MPPVAISLELHTVLSTRLEELAGEDRPIQSYEARDLGCGVTAFLCLARNFGVSEDRYTVLLFSRAPGERLPTLVREYGTNQRPEGF